MKLSHEKCRFCQATENWLRFADEPSSHIGISYTQAQHIYNIYICLYIIYIYYRLYTYHIIISYHSISYTFLSNGCPTHDLQPPVVPSITLWSLVASTVSRVVPPISSTFPRISSASGYFLGKMMENDGKWWKMMENDGKSGPSCTEDQKFWKIWVNVPLPKHHLWRLHQAMQASPSRFSHPSRHPIWTVGKIEPIPQNLLPFGITCKCRIKTTNKHLWNYNLELPFIDDFPSCKPPLIRDFLLPRLITGKVFNVLSAAFWPFGAKK